MNTDQKQIPKLNIFKMMNKPRVSIMDYLQQPAQNVISDLKKLNTLNSISQQDYLFKYSEKSPLIKSSHDYYFDSENDTVKSMPKKLSLDQENLDKNSSDLLSQSLQPAQIVKNSRTKNPIIRNLNQYNQNGFQSGTENQPKPRQKKCKSDHKKRVGQIVKNKNIPRKKERLFDSSSEYEYDEDSTFNMSLSNLRKNSQLANKVQDNVVHVEKLEFLISHIKADIKKSMTQPSRILLNRQLKNQFRIQKKQNQLVQQNILNLKNVIPQNQIQTTLKFPSFNKVVKILLLLLTLLILKGYKYVLKVIYKLSKNVLKIM